MISISQQPTNSPTLGTALLNYIQKGFPIAPKWSIVSCIVLLVAFFAVAEQVATGAPWVAQCNAVIAGTIQSLRCDALTAFFSAFTQLSSEIANIIYCVALLVFLVVRKRWDDIVYVFGNLLVIVILMYGTKFVLHITRPVEQAIIDLPFDPSFPSGHTVLSFTLAFIFGMLILVSIRKHDKPEAWGYIAIAVLFIYAATIAFSRIYLGVHWGTDVIAGMLLAFAWGLPTFSWFVKQYPRERFHGGADPYGVKAILAKREAEKGQN